MEISQIDAGGNLLAAQIEGLVVGNHLGENIKHTLKQAVVSMRYSI